MLTTRGLFDLVSGSEESDGVGVIVLGVTDCEVGADGANVRLQGLSWLGFKVIPGGGLPLLPYADDPLPLCSRFCLNRRYRAIPSSSVAARVLHTNLSNISLLIYKM